MIEDIWSQFSGITIESNTIFEGMNADLYDKLPKTFTVRRNGESSEGFLYGNEDQPILEETDLVYVGPNGEEPYDDFFHGTTTRCWVRAKQTTLEFIF
jgi:hypothetical protein